jgi:hypothetical protein
MTKVKGSTPQNNNSVNTSPSSSPRSQQTQNNSAAQATGYLLLKHLTWFNLFINNLYLLKF